GALYYQSTTRPLSADAAPFPFQQLPIVQTTWGKWRASHPDTTLFVGDHTDVVISTPPVGEPVLGRLLEYGLPFAPALLLLLFAMARRTVRRRARPALDA